RAFSWNRAQSDGVIQQARQSVHDRESEAEPLARIAIDSFQLRELAENLAMLLHRNTMAAIPHLDPDGVAVAAAAEDDTTAVGVADCVGHQVAYDPLEQLRIAANEDGCLHDR